MEAPTPNHIGTNLYNREQEFSLAPPCHPDFSGCNQMEATTSCVQAPTWTSEDNSPPEHLPTSLRYQWLNKNSTLQINQFIPILLCSVNLVFCCLLYHSALLLLYSIILLCFSSALLFFSASALLYCSALLQLCSIVLLYLCSALSFCSSTLYFICSACPFLQSSYTIHFILYINQISSLTPSPFSFLTVSFFFHSEQPTQFSLAHFLLYTIP